MKRQQISQAAAVSLILGAVSGHTANFTSTWNGFTGNWSDPLNWTTPGAPGTAPNNGGSTYDAVLGSGASTLDLDITVENLAFSGGTLAGGFNLTLTNNLTWTGGVLTGSGLTTVAGTASTIDPTLGNVFLGRTLVNSGTMTLTAGDSGTPFYFGSDPVSAGVINNVGTFNVISGGDFAQYYAPGGQAIHNSGIFNVSGAGTTSTVSNGIAFHNTGTVNVSSGAFELQGGDGGSTTTGVFNVAAGGILRVQGAMQFADSSTFAGAGAVELGAGGVATFDGNFQTGIAAFSVTGGTLTGTGTFSTSANFHWTSGTLNGAGTTNIAGSGSTIESSSSIVFLGRVLANSGTLTFNTSDTNPGIYFGSDPISPGVLNNSGLFNVTAGGDFTQYYGPAGQGIHNSGTFNVSGPGTTSRVSGGIAFQNTGTVNVNSGTLLLQGGDGGSTTGVFNISGPGVLRFEGGDFTFGGPSTFAGAGAVQIAAGIATFDGTFNSTVAELHLSGGVLNGAGAFNATGNLRWTGGAMGGTGSTSIAGTASLVDGSSNNLFLGRTLTNTGTLTFTSPDNVVGVYFGPDLSSPGVLNNSGTIQVTAGNDFFQYFNPAGQAIHNSGVFQVSGAGTTSTVGAGIFFENSGTVNVTSGELRFEGGDGGSTTGVFNLAAPGTLRIHSDFNFEASSTFSGAGTVIFSNGTSNLSGSNYNVAAINVTGGRVNFNASDAAVTAVNLSGSGMIGGTGKIDVSGDLHWTGGTMLGTGVTNLAGVGSTIDTTGGPVFLGRVLDNRGTLTFAADDNSYPFYFGPDPSSPGIFRNFGTLNVIGGGDFYRYSPDPGDRIFNMGVLNVSGAGTTSTIGSGIAFFHSGTINVQSGTLEFNGTDGVGVTGVFNISSGATLRLREFCNFDDLSTFAGAGLVEQPSGTSTFDGTFNSTVAQFRLAGGALTGSGTFNSGGLLQWVGGAMTGSGITNANGGMTMNSNGASLSLNGRTLNLAAGQTTTWIGDALIGGDIRLQNGATINNFGTFLAQSDQYLYDFGGGGTFNNAGTFTRNNAGVLTVYPGVAFHNTGVANLQTGTLSLQGGDGGSTTGAFNTSAGAVLSFASDFNFAAGSSIAGAGTVNFAAGATNVAGTYNVTGTSTFTGATVNFNSPITSLGTGSLIISSGAVNFNSNAVTVTGLALSGGTLGGTANVTVTGQTNWTGGSMAGPGATNVNGGMTIDSSGSNLALLGGRVLTISAGQTATWLGAAAAGGDFRFQNGSIINNQGTFLAQSDQYVYDLDATGNVFNNAGTFTRNNNAGLLALGVPFHNTGAVNVQTGILAFQGGDGGSTTGTHNLSAGATLRLQSEFTFTGSSAFAGAGLVELNSIARFDGVFNSTVAEVRLIGNLTGTGTFNSGGLLRWTGGSMTGTGLTNANGGLIIISSGANLQLLGGRTLTNAAGQTATWIGDSNLGGDLRFQSGSTLNNLGTFLAQSDQFVYDVGGGGTIRNAGTFTRNTAGTLTITTGITFDNPGTVNVTTGGILSLAATTVPQYAGDTLTGGVWFVGAASQLLLPSTGTGVITNQADITLSGAGSVLRAGALDDTLERRLATNSGALRILANRNYTSTNALATSGILQLGGGNFTAPGLTNSAAGEIFGFGIISVRPTNSGLLRAAGGTLTMANGIQDGNGRVQIDAGAVLNLNGGASGSGADFLVHNGTTASSLNLGTNTFTVDVDYTNASFGVGNAFNPRANVAGSGPINASGAIAQQLSGNVTNGTTAAVTLAFGNVHVGDAPSRAYQINNAGASGPSLRGAVQTTVNGGSLTDVRLTGTGVTAANFGPIAPGANSGDRTVTFTASAAGALTAQTVRLLNNFDNVADQTLTITGAAYRYALPTAHTPEPINFGNFHVGATAPSQLLSLTNNVPNDGFSEALNAAFGSTTGGVTTSGSFNLLAPGATNSTSLTVGINTSTAGSKNGIATLTLTSDGTGSSGLGLTLLAAQTVNVTGSVFRYASPTTHTPEPINFGNFHVGDVVASQPLTLTNNVPNDGFSETLNATIGSATGGMIASGSFAALAPSATNSTSLLFGINTSTAGLKNGSATITLTSNGAGNSGLGLTPLASQTVNGTGSVYRLAAPSAHTPEPVNFGNVHVGDVVALQALTIANTATNDTFSEALNAAIGSPTGGMTASGSFNLLAPGATNNSSLLLGMNTSTAGLKNGTATITLTSNGSGSSGLGLTALTSQTVNGIGAVYRLASPTTHTPEPIAFGNFHVGDAAPSQALTLTNNVPNDGYSEALDASLGSPTGGVTASGSFSLLAPSATNSTSLLLGLNTSTPGSKNGTALLTLTSNGSGSSGLGLTSLASQTVNVTGSVFRLALPSAHSPEPINFGNFHVGDVVASQPLTLTNNAIADGFSEALNATLGSVTGGMTATGSFTGLAAGATNNTSLLFGINTSTAGLKNGSATITLTSNGAGNSGLGLTPLASQTVNGTGSVFRLAAPSAHTPEPVNFGNVHVGDFVALQALTIANTATNDTFSEALNAAIGSPTGGMTASGSFTLLAPGATNNSSLLLGMNTSTAGLKNGTATITLTSNGSGSSGLGLTSLASQLVNGTGAVYRLALPSAHSPEPINLGNFHGNISLTTVPLSITNLAPADGFSESLNASIAVSSGALFASGSFNALAPGAANNSGLTVRFGNNFPGLKNGTATITFASNGAGSSGLGLTALPTQTVNVTGAIYRFAEPSATFPSTTVPSAYHLGDVAQDQIISVTNNAIADGFSESADVTISPSDPTFITFGSTTQLAPGATATLGFRVNTSTAGLKETPLSLSYASNGAGSSGLGVTQLDIRSFRVFSSVYRLAQGFVSSPSPFNVGNLHVGDTTTTLPLAVSNIAFFDGFSEALDASFGTPTGNARGSGSFTGLASGFSAIDNTSLRITVDTSATGIRTGTLPLLLASNGNVGGGASGLGITPLPTQTIDVTGRVYRLAEPTVSSGTTVDLGIVHVGETASRVINVRNDATADAFSERLRASLTGTTGNATGNGITSLAPGAIGNLNVGIDTSSAGSKSGTATIGFTSDGAGTSGLGLTALPSGTVSVLAQVNNYAAPVFLFDSGSATLSGSGTSYLLDFGYLHIDAGALSAQLRLSNAATGPADLLSGSFAGSVPDFSLSGFGAFSALAAGQSRALSISFDPSAEGVFNETITLSPFSDNASTSTARGPITLTFHGTAVPEPSAIASLLGALGALSIFGLRLRRRG